MAAHWGTVRVVGMASLLWLGAPHLRAQQASAKDTAFVGKVSQGGMYEVEASKLAVGRATLPKVKAIAVTEVHEHENVNGELKTLAAKQGVPVAARLSPEFAARLKALGAADDFDAAYLKDMAAIHDKDEKLFAEEAGEGTEAWKPFAAKTDGIVKRHIEAIAAELPKTQAPR